MSSKRLIQVGVLLAVWLMPVEVVTANKTTSLNIDYQQHWIPPDTPSSYGQGQAVATYPSVGEMVSPVTLSVVLNDTGYTKEWNNGKKSEWDLVSSVDGANWVAEQTQVNPQSVAPHSAPGKMTVDLSVGLDKTNGQQKQKNFECTARVGD